MVGLLNKSRVKSARRNQGTEELPALQHLAQLEQVWIVGMSCSPNVDRAHSMHAEGGAQPTVDVSPSVGLGVARWASCFNECRPFFLARHCRRCRSGAKRVKAWC